MDRKERYPWRFPGNDTERHNLAVGDYALMDGDSMLAVVERKTMDNLLADFGMMPVLHERLAELATYDCHALVIEAPYSDFLNPKKTEYYSPTFCARSIGELYAIHPNLRIVFCANRKVANEWVRHYFRAIWGVRQGSGNPAQRAFDGRPPN
ncbi:MAG: ERCC4 domain-containing protein [Dehalococcoidia bacterium]